MTRLYQVIEWTGRPRASRRARVTVYQARNQGDAAAGYGCIAEKRAREIIEGGSAATGYMAFGDRLRIEVLDAGGGSVFGAIDQRVAPLAGGA